MTGGPLAGMRVVEFAGLGAVPFAAMLLADLGADVVRVDRAGSTNAGIPKGNDVLNRGRRSIAVDLKNPDGLAVVRRLVEKADAMLEGFRPGVLERLGLGPDELLALNPRLVYGRVTGWGRQGPLAVAPSHDINAIALAGALEPIGRAGEPPVPALSLIGDFGGGGMVLALGVVSAMLDAQRGGRGQVVDASMVAGAALLTTLFYGLHAHGEWGPRGTNPLDSGAPCYEVYRTADDRYVCIGSLEPQFYAALRAKLDLTDPMWDRQMDPAAWPAQKDELARVFATRTRAEWTDLLEGTDVCFAPVLSLAEAPGHEQNRANGTFVDIDGIVQPAPGPAFGRTTLTTPTAPPVIGEHTEQLLAEFGYAPEEIERLRVDRAVA